MRICFTLDDVLRAKTVQFGKIYQKYINPDIDLSAIEITEKGLADDFGFETIDDYNDFIYKDYPFEVFAEANPTEKTVDKQFNFWHMNLNNNDELDDKIEIVLANPMEFNASIGYTYFFLSKIATRVREVYLPKDSLSIWDKCDVLVTADKNLLDNKPEGKKSVKINMPYNTGTSSDLEYEHLSDLLNDKDFIKKISNND